MVEAQRAVDPVLHGAAHTVAAEKADGHQQQEADAQVGAIVASVNSVTLLLQ